MRARIKIGDVINDMRLTARVGRTSTSELYIAREINTPRGMPPLMKVLKFEDIRGDKKGPLYNEAYIYRLLKFYRDSRSAGGFTYVGVPQVGMYICLPRKYHALEIQYLGHSVKDIINDIPENRFRLKDVLMVARQVIRILEYLHSCFILHLNVEPENIMMGPTYAANRIFLIDFGAAVALHDPIKDPLTFRSEAPATSIRPGVAMEFASATVLEGLCPTRKDDLESLGYVLAYLFKGQLPWSAALASDIEAMKRMKHHIHPEILFSDMPCAFREYFEAVRRMGGHDVPDYDALERLFADTMEQLNFSYDSNFSWM